MNKILLEFLEAIDGLRVMAPWLEWALTNKVKLHVSHYIAYYNETLYVIPPALYNGWFVITGEQTWKKLQLKFVGASDQELANMIAWNVATDMERK